MTRFARMYINISPSDCDPPHSLDMESERDSNKVAYLESAFRSQGFDRDMPALIGYPLNGRIQLLTGTHRHEAASRTGIQLPVHIIPRSTVEHIWGTPQWDIYIKDTPVKDLEEVPVMEGFVKEFSQAAINMNDIIWRY